LIPDWVKHGPAAAGKMISPAAETRGHHHPHLQQSCILSPNELIFFIFALAMPAIVRPNNLYRFDDTATPALITFQD